VSPAPRIPRDLMLTPVALEIDQNLRHIRDMALPKLVYELELELDRPAMNLNRSQRANRVLEAALQNVNLHGWSAKITSDGARLRLSGGSVTLDIGLSASILNFITGSKD